MKYPFYIETNACGTVTLNEATPCFGFYAEYNRDLTLKEWQDL